MFIVALSATKETESQHPPVGGWANKIKVDLRVLTVKCTRTSLAVQRLRLCSSTTVGTGSTPGQETRIPHVTQRSQKFKK